MHVAKFCSSAQQRAAGALDGEAPARPSIARLRADLRVLGADEGAAESCKFFLRELESAASILASLPGSAGISRKLVRAVFMHWGANTLPVQVREQQLVIRSRTGGKIAFLRHVQGCGHLGRRAGRRRDQAWQGEGRPVRGGRSHRHGRARPRGRGGDRARREARVDGDCVEGAPRRPAERRAEPAPSRRLRQCVRRRDARPVPRSVMHRVCRQGLQRLGARRACNRRSMHPAWYTGLHSRRCEFELICHQPTSRSSHPSRKISQLAEAQSYASCARVRRSGGNKAGKRSSFADEMPSTADGALRVGYGTVKKRRLANSDDLSALDVASLVTVTQDSWHSKERLMRLIPKDAADRALFDQRCKEIFKRASPKLSSLIHADTPANMLTVVEAEVRAFQRDLLSLIPQFSTAQGTDGSKRAVLCTAVRDLGAVYSSDVAAAQPAVPEQGAPAAEPHPCQAPQAAALTAPALADIPGPPRCLGDPLSLVEADRIEAVAASEVKMPLPDVRNCMAVDFADM
jgi:hypothetical protein